MKSLRVRLALWFGVSFVAITLVFVAFTYHYLEQELHAKNWEKNYPNHPDWNIHGSYSETEVRDIMTELVETDLGYAIPLALVALLLGYLLARKSVRPIASVNQQLQSINPKKLSQRINLEEVDSEFRDLVRHINDLLGRLENSFRDMSEYAAKVSHELRTPLAIMRLKVEHAAGGKMPPDLAEELQAELHQLTHVVDQSLLIAKAEQGRLTLQPRPFCLRDMIKDVVEDYSLLAQEEGRTLEFVDPVPGEVNVDPKYARQIIHNLLANALKHGQGKIQLRLSETRSTRTLTILNQVRREPTRAQETLGLGLRVVDTLLNLPGGMRYQRRRGKHYYAVRLFFAPAEPSAS